MPVTVNVAFGPGDLVPLTCTSCPTYLAKMSLLWPRGSQAGDLQHETVEKYVLPELFVDAAGQRLLRRRNGFSCRGALDSVTRACPPPGRTKLPAI